MRISVSAQNFRSLQMVENLPITPITILVGENSSGKSTLLALLNLLFGDVLFPFRTNFNSLPFELGSYDSIASRKGPQKGGRAQSFSIAFNLEGYPSSGNKYSLRAEFIDRKGQPVISKIFVETEKVSIDIDIATVESYTITDVSDGTKWKLDSAIDKNENPVSGYPFNELFYTLVRQLSGQDKKKEPVKNEIPRWVLEHILNMISLRHGSRPSVLALSAIRSKPERTYDQIQPQRNPEGGHVPYILAERLDENSNLKRIIENFGQSTGLYDELSVKRHSAKPSSPFMLTVKGNKSHPFNLVDVGYGVSQSLPIVVDSVETSAKIILVQQPEVHLHPKAQSGLADFFIEVSEKMKKKFVIETHSDYLIDRIRMLVRQGRVSADDVTLIYFEKKSSATSIHPMKIDEQGNLIGVTKSYQKFFLKHQLDLMGD